MTIPRRTILTLLVAAGLGCPRETAKMVDPPSPATSTQPPAALARTPDPEPRKRNVEAVVASSAMFAANKLVACVDLAAARDPLAGIVARGPRTKDGGPLPGPEQIVAEDLSVFLLGGDSLVGAMLDHQFGKGASRSLRPTGKPAPIGQPCSVQFESRTVVGACSTTTSEKSLDGLAVALGITYYDALMDDAAMKSCFLAKGQWHELGKNSPEFVRAEQRQMLDHLREQLAKP